MPSKQKPRYVAPVIGDIVHVVFWDHSQDFGQTMLFEAFGRVTKKDRKQYVIHCWRYHDPAQRAKDNNPHHNESNFAIVRSAIESIKVLK